MTRERKIKQKNFISENNFKGLVITQTNVFLACLCIICWKSQHFFSYNLLLHPHVWTSQTEGRRMNEKLFIYWTSSWKSLKKHLMCFRHPSWPTKSIFFSAWISAYSKLRNDNNPDVFCIIYALKTYISLHFLDNHHISVTLHYSMWVTHSNPFSSSIQEHLRV